MSNDNSDLGKVACNLRGAIVAGSYQTCLLKYTAGLAGIDDTGSIKVVMRYATDAGVPQFDDPRAANYVTATASNGARRGAPGALRGLLSVHMLILKGRKFL